MLAVHLLVAYGGRLFDPRVAQTSVVFLPAAACLAGTYEVLLEAFDRGRVTVVAPLKATQSLSAVGLAALLLGRSEAIGRRLVAAAVLIVAGSALIGTTPAERPAQGVAGSPPHVAARPQGPPRASTRFRA